MRRLNEDQVHQFATAFITQARLIVPEWTNVNDSDPGVTLLELFAFLTENLLYRANKIPNRGGLVAQQLADAALALAGTSNLQDECPLERLNYFHGRLLSADDFTQEQAYFRARLRRRNRFLHGTGIVSGLQVSVGKDNQGPHVTIQPGLAFDPRGEEIEVCAPHVVPVPMDAKSLLVQLLFTEKLTHPMPTNGELEQQFSRVQETVTIVLAPKLKPNAVSVARLLFGRATWRVDRLFKPQRARP